jgi:hypothetical protein
MRVSSSEFIEWLAYFKLQPTTGDRLDWGFAYSNYLLAYINTDQRKSHKLRFNEFLPSWQREDEKLIDNNKVKGQLEMMRMKFGKKKGKN